MDTDLQKFLEEQEAIVSPPEQSLERIAIALEVLVAHWMEVES